MQDLLSTSLEFGYEVEAIRIIGKQWSNMNRECLLITRNHSVFRPNLVFLTSYALLLQPILFAATDDLSIPV